MIKNDPSLELKNVIAKQLTIFKNANKNNETLLLSGRPAKQSLKMPLVGGAGRGWAL